MMYNVRYLARLSVVACSPRFFPDWPFPRVFGEGRALAPAVDMLDRKDEVILWAGLPGLDQKGHSLPDRSAPPGWGQQPERLRKRGEVAPGDPAAEPLAVVIEERRLVQQARNGLEMLDVGLGHAVRLGE